MRRSTCFLTAAFTSFCMCSTARADVDDVILAAAKDRAVVLSTTHGPVEGTLLAFDTTKIVVVAPSDELFTVERSELRQVSLTPANVAPTSPEDQVPTVEAPAPAVSAPAPTRTYVPAAEAPVPAAEAPVPAAEAPVPAAPSPNVPAPKKPQAGLFTPSNAWFRLPYDAPVVVLPFSDHLSDDPRDAAGSGRAVSKSLKGALSQVRTAHVATFTPTGEGTSVTGAELAAEVALQQQSWVIYGDCTEFYRVLWFPPVRYDRAGFNLNVVNPEGAIVHQQSVHGKALAFPQPEDVLDRISNDMVMSWRMPEADYHRWKIQRAAGWTLLPIGVLATVGFNMLYYSGEGATVATVVGTGLATVGVNSLADSNARRREALHKRAPKRFTLGKSGPAIELSSVRGQLGNRGAGISLSTPTLIGERFFWETGRFSYMIWDSASDVVDSVRWNDTIEWITTVPGLRIQPAKTKDGFEGRIGIGFGFGMEHHAAVHEDDLDLDSYWYYDYDEEAEMEVRKSLRGWWSRGPVIAPEGYVVLHPERRVSTQIGIGTAIPLNADTPFVVSAFWGLRL